MSSKPCPEKLKTNAIKQVVERKHPVAEFASQLVMLSLIGFCTLTRAAGDGSYVGSDQQGDEGFTYRFSVAIPEGEGKAASGIRILRDRTTWTDYGQGVDPHWKIDSKGCYLFPDGYAATAVICLPDAEPAFFRNVIYAKRTLKGKEQFVCVNNCTKQLPKAFVWVTD